MPKFTIELPDDCADLVAVLEKVAKEIHAATPETRGGRAVDFAKFEGKVEQIVGELERETIRRLLQRLDVDAPQVRIRGRLHTQVGRYEAPYNTKAGAVTVLRSIYRDDAVRNERTVDAVSLRAGVIGDGWLPQTAAAIAFAVQQQPSREAQAVAQKLGRLPYSRSSFERVAHLVGEMYEIRSDEVEDALVAAYEIPTDARSVSVGMDRIAVPMEEPRPRPVGRPRTNAPKNPISRNYRMAYVATVTLHDETGEALHTIRYGRMPQGDAASMVAGAAADVATLLSARPDLKVTRLCDGAPEMQNLLAAEINDESLGVAVHDFVDFWHVIEKLAKAADVMDAEDSGARLACWKLKLLNQNDAAAAVLDELLSSGKEDVLVGKTRPVHDAITYFKNNADRMNYAEARRRGLPIGSGNTEATCKSLFETRLKRSGARWKDHTGERVVQLRALALSDRWNDGVTHSLRDLRTPVRAA
jgi:hypothetical protein